MNGNYEQSIYYANVNINFMIENLIQIKSGIKINADVSVSENRKPFVQKDYIWNPATFSCKNSKHLASTIDNSVITGDKIINVATKSYDETIKIIPTKLTSANFYIYSSFY